MDGIESLYIRNMDMKKNRKKCLMIKMNKFIWDAFRNFKSHNMKVEKIAIQDVFWWYYHPSSESWVEDRQSILTH